ncbi:MAG: hypothetical protein HYZ26_10935 [Chloroflexi bacterium]|nr:hypothetical protein [Chloroflexota bacterium]
MSDIFSLPANWKTAKPAVFDAFGLLDLDVLQSFDLKGAESALKACSCPHHGTRDCECEYVVLLVYGGDEAPITLEGHGDGSRILFDLDSLPYHRIRSSAVAMQIRWAFEHARRRLAAGVELGKGA